MLVTARPPRSEFARLLAKVHTGTPHHANAEKVLEILQETHVVEKRGLGLEINKKVDITIRARLAASDGPKYRNLTSASAMSDGQDFFAPTAKPLEGENVGGHGGKRTDRGAGPLSSLQHRPPPAAAGRQYLHRIAGSQLHRDLVPKRPPSRLVPSRPQPVLPHRTGSPTRQAPRLTHPPLRDERQRRRLQHLNNPLNPLTPRRQSRPTAPPPQPIPQHPYRISTFQCF